MSHAPVGAATLALLLSVGLGAPAVAAPSVSASVDRTTVPMGETVALSITLTGADGAAAPSLGNLSGFDVVSTGQSRAFSMTGGAASVETVFEYVLSPTSTGTKTIPPIEVHVGNQVLRTNALTVVVSEGRGGAGAGTPPTLPMPGLPPTEVTPATGDDVFIRCTVDKKRAYVGEQLLLTFSLYYAAHLGGVNYEPAGTEGFRTQPLPAPAARYETVNGRQYVVKQELKLLFPTAPGTHTIAPAKLQYATGYWDAAAKTLTTEPIAIEVSRLPEAGKPAGFSGAVGQLQVAVQIDRDTLRMGEAATLTISVIGWGNLDAMEPPRLVLPEGLRQYQSREHREFAPQTLGEGFRMAGEALFDHVIIPTTTGDLAISPVEVAYFDPTTERYEVARSRPIVLHVQPGDGQTPAVAPGQTAPLKPLPDRLTGGRREHLLSAPLLASQVVALGWLVAAGLVRRRRSGLLADPKLARARAAARRATRLAALSGALPPREAATEIASAVAGYLADKLDLPAATVSAGSVAGLLADCGASAESSARVVAVLSACDALRFGPLGDANARELSDQAVAAIRDLDRQLKPAGGRR